MLEIFIDFIKNLLGFESDEDEADYTYYENQENLNQIDKVAEPEPVENLPSFIKGRPEMVFISPWRVYASAKFKGKKHLGLDVQCRLGDEPEALQDGKVIKIKKNGKVGKRGSNFIEVLYKMLDGSDAYFTIKYKHTKPYFKKGQTFQKGQSLGVTDNTGFWFGQHSHDEVWVVKGYRGDIDFMAEPWVPNDRYPKRINLSLAWAVRLLAPHIEMSVVKGYWHNPINLALENHSPGTLLHIAESQE